MDERPFCRTCLANNSNETTLSSIQVDKISDILMECVPIQIDKEETSFICSSCKQVLLDFYTFRTRSIHIDNIVKNVLPQQKYPRSQLDANRKYTVSDEHGEVIKNEDVVNVGCVQDEELKYVKCYECHYCKELFDNKTILVEHVKQHTVNKTFACIYCEETFTGIAQISRHLNTLHAHSKPQLTCLFCCETHHIPEQIAFHVALEHCQAKCPFCSRTFNNKNYCSIHVRREHTEQMEQLGIRLARTKYHKRQQTNKEKCHVCKRNVQCLRVHLKSHNRLAWYACPACPQKIYGIRKFNGHLKIAHSELKASIKCESCPLMFHTSEQLRGHECVPQKRKTCQVCDIRFVTIRNLRRHLKSVHETNSVKCDVCHKMLRNKIQLRSHMNGHNVNSAIRSKSICNVCGRTFANIKSHVKNQHGARDTFRCRFKHCPLIFGSHVLSQTHYQNDHANEPYKNECNMCGKKFRNNQGLYNHRKFTHSDNRTFQCSTCDKSFKKKSQLIVHTRSHTDERAFPCDICGKAFRHNHTLTKHKMTHNGQKRLFECAICHKRFTQSSTLNKHMHHIHSNLIAQQSPQMGGKSMSEVSEKSTINEVKLTR